MVGCSTQYFCFLAFISLVTIVHPDCGCQANRDVIEAEEPENIWTSDARLCSQNAERSNRRYQDYYPEKAEAHEIDDHMAFITGGSYNIGTDEQYFKSDLEGPERTVMLQQFLIDKYEVSNAKFSQFVAATGYKTEAELFGDSFLFKTFLTPLEQEAHKDVRVVNALWWYKVNNTSWQHPNGPHSNLDGLEEHPVVHVSWHDAVAYCDWAGKRLPTEPEWEVACRGGKKGKLFPWGNKLMPHDRHWLNIWQGDFPDGNTKEDGFQATCPVTEFRQNDYNLYNMVGNVWEWTADKWDPLSKDKNPYYVKKGGSYLCHKSYCYRYRCAARSQNGADSSAGNLGFRCAKDAVQLV